MRRRYLVLFPMLALGWSWSAQARDPLGAHSDASSRPESAARVAQPQGASNRVRVMSDAEVIQMDQLDRQKRRDVLREALRSQPEEAPATVRQMSLQERTELRQQLRQQQEWLK